MQNNLVSIIMPIKNGKNYMQEAIESIKAQDGVRMEIIVVDDASTDETADIAQRLGCKVIKHETNKGQVVGKNTGLKVANGDFVMFCDHDDLLTPNALKTMLAEFDKDSKIMAVMTKTKDFISPEIPKETKVPLKKEAYFGRLGSSALIKRQVFDIIGAFDESVVAGEIIDWQSKMDKNKLKIHKLDFISALRRIHATNFGRTHRKAEFKDYATLLKNRIKINSQKDGK